MHDTGRHVVIQASCAPCALEVEEFLEGQNGFFGVGGR